MVSSVDWAFEPYWRGERLIAAVQGGRISLTDEHGATASAGLDEAARALERAVVDAEGAVIDGVWTAQPFLGEGSEDRLAGELSVDPFAETRRAFVAIDLLELDGAPLYDVPYLERRRLLESVIEENVRVRISPAVRLPIDSWVAAWRSNGFDSYVAKHVNSRYHPGETADDWLRLTTAPTGDPSPIDRLFGRRGKAVVRIEDSRAGGTRPPRG